MKARHLLHIIILSVILILTGNRAFAQGGDVIAIAGNVKDEQGNPIENVKISRLGDQNAIASTDEAGYFQFFIEEDAVLLFSHISYEEKQVIVGGRQEFDIVLNSFAYDVEEVVFVAKSLKPIVEETDMEIKGDYLYINPRVKLTESSFQQKMRAIIQPIVTNVRTGERFFMKPRVVDGNTFSIKQKRIYNFDISNDPLFRYRDDITYKNGDFYVAYNDSIYLHDKSSDYSAFVYISLENFNNVVSVDSVNMSNGVVNPLRFLECDFTYYEITDTNYIPKRELQLFDEKWKADFVFKVSRAELDLKNPRNAKTIDDMKERLSAIENNPFMRLRSFNISGMASPEGSYKLNSSLAEKRMKALQEIVMDLIPPKTAKYVEFSHDSKVASWKDAVELLERDSLMEEAAALNAVINRYPGKLDQQSNRVKGLKFYNKLIKEEYLPQLRKVEYSYQYSLYRILNDAEIAALYKKNYKEMTRFEFYRLLKSFGETPEREKICRKAMMLYPKTLWFANELAVISLKTDNPKPAILGAFDPAKLPEEALRNQTAALFRTGHYQDADSLFKRIKNLSEGDIYLQGVIAARAGDFEKAYSIFKDRYPFNEVLLLLSLKKNEEAWDKAQKLGNTPKELYIKAVAANRLALLEAYDYIAFALEMDPSLRAIAEIDADVKDILADETF